MLSAQGALSVEPIISTDLAEESPYPGKATLTRELDIVILEGEKIPGLCGKALGKIRMLTYKNNQFHPIPFQIDERDAEDKLVFPNGKKATGDQDPMFDGNDLFLCMAHDLGDQAPQDRIADLGLAVEEIEAEDPLDGSRAWGYIVFSQEPVQASEIDYVHYTIEKGKIDTVDARHYSIHYPWGQFYTSNCIVPPSSGGTGENFLDRFKARGTFMAFFSLVTVSITEDRMGSEVIAHIDGPIRVIRRVAYWANIGFGIRSTSFEADITYYASFVNSPLTVRVPVRLDLVLSQAYTDIGIDYNHRAYGMVFINSNNPDGTIIDGRMSPQEEAMDLSMDEWRLTTGPQGTFFRGAIPQCEFVSQVTISPHYVDDYRIPDPPEDEPGQIGHVFDRIDMIHLRAGVYHMELQFFIQPKYHPEDEKKYLSIEKAPLKVSAKSLKN